MFCNDVTLQENFKVATPSRLRSPPQQGKPSSPTTRVRPCSSTASSSTVHGLSRECLSVASSAGPPTSRAPVQSPTSISTTECPSGDPSVLPCSAWVHDLCPKLGAVVLTGDFHKGAERELLLVVQLCARSLAHLGGPPLWAPLLSSMVTSSSIVAIS